MKSLPTHCLPVTRLLTSEQSELIAGHLAWLCTDWPHQSAAGTLCLCTLDRVAPRMFSMVLTLLVSRPESWDECLLIPNYSNLLRIVFRELYPQPKRHEQTSLRSLQNCSGNHLASFDRSGVIVWKTEACMYFFPGPPVLRCKSAFTSHSLTDTECHYAMIEKEMLSIVDAT